MLPLNWPDPARAKRERQPSGNKWRQPTLPRPQERLLMTQIPSERVPEWVVGKS